MYRREYLGSLVSAISIALAGCATTVEEPTAELSMTPLSRIALLPRIMRSIDAEGSNEPVHRIIDGRASITAVRPPYPENVHTYFNGTVYEFSYDVTDRSEVTAYTIRLEPVDRYNESETVPLSGLPRVDRRKLTELGFTDSNATGLVRSVGYYEGGIARSDLVPTPEDPILVLRDGSRARVVVGVHYNQTIERYRYSAERVASKEAYVDRLEDRFGFALDGLSESERDIVRRAIENDAYVVEDGLTPSSAFRSLLDRFRNQSNVHSLTADPPDHVSGNYLVDFDGTTYLTTIVLEDDFE